MTLLQQIADIIGPIPAGYEIIAYISGFFMLVFLCSWGFSLIAGVINSIIGRR